MGKFQLMRKFQLMGVKSPNHLEKFPKNYNKIEQKSSILMTLISAKSDDLLWRYDFQKIFSHIECALTFSPLEKFTKIIIKGPKIQHLMMVISAKTDDSLWRYDFQKTFPQNAQTSSWENSQKIIIK